LARRTTQIWKIGRTLTELYGQKTFGKMRLVFLLKKF
jgi:hypothetical protein